MSSAETALPDQSPSHSMTLAWVVIWTFGVIGLFVFGLAFEAAIHFIFGQRFT